MDSDLVKRRQRELSKKQAIYVAARERGLPRQKSAVIAGYADVDKAGEQVEQSLVVQEELQKARDSMVAATGITKEVVAAGLLDAAVMAKVMADPAAMVRAWAELGKLLGHYAPEVKKIEHMVGRETRELLQRMSDAELLKLAHGRVIEGESKVIDEPNS